ncbi:Alternative oxidase, mitochondrial [Grifola frondosa]|uniref:Alternative oxidase n=1 Tax=Grifola frondosa TaxID=5627 RepID=A0A1C7M489_GRIFR|nr:Alternative oxidase, mitochondrial [Grifola frondosa]
MFTPHVPVAARGRSIAVLRPRFTNVSRRSLMSGAPRMSASPALTSTRTDEASASVEGRHNQVLPAKHTSYALTREDAVSTVPDTMREVKGDWVLFHPVYTAEELRSVAVMHRDAKTISDNIAWSFVRLLRWGFDVVSGYKHKPLPTTACVLSLDALRNGGYIMDERQWLRRFLFLESIAAVPGMVAATLRHLRSLRLMRRDSGWIHTLLEEAENERMHLMTFMTLRQPSLLFRAMVLGAQGFFYNMFFLCYMISPSTCHRFVGHLEEEAVLTYTRCIKEMEAGRLPQWSNLPAPDIAKDYWRLGPDAKFLDVIYAVRSDESTHRFVNHSLANLDHKTDVNPFALREPDMSTKGSKLCFERDEAEKYVEASHKIIQDGKPIH